MDKTEKYILIFFILVIIGSISFSVFYFIVNSMSLETINVLYPMIGGILLTIFLGIKSLFIDIHKHKTILNILNILYPIIGGFVLTLYLGIKSIYLDAPKPKTFGVMTVIFQDYNKGQIKSLVPFGELKYTTQLQFGIDFLGSYLFDALQNDTAFSELNISEILQNSPIGENSDSSTIMIGHFIEYAILSWLNYPFMWSNIKTRPHNDGIINILYGGGGALLTGQELVDTSIMIEDHEPNPLVKAKPFKIKLPNGSKIVRYIDGLPLKFEIVTRHSRIQISCGFSTFDQLGIPWHKDAKRFYEILNWPTNIQDQGLFAWGIDIDFIVSQFPFRRFSNQAKLESQWLNRLPEQLEKGFSWSKLKKIYMQD